MLASMDTVASAIRSIGSPVEVLTECPNSDRASVVAFFGEIDGKAAPYVTISGLARDDAAELQKILTAAEVV